VVNLALIFKKLALEKGKVSPRMVYEYLGGKKPYMSIVRAFHVLRELGLIELVEEKENSRRSPIKERFYAIAKGKENDPCWEYYWYCYYDLKGMTDKIPESYKVLGYYPWRRGEEK